MKYHIENEVWKQIYEFLCACKGIPTRNEPKLRKFIEAIWYVARSGCQWRLLPFYMGAYYGDRGQ